MYKQRWQSRIFLIIGLITSVMTHSTTTPALNPDHPNSYIMKEGDTLWDISSIFLEDQWLWPEIWRAYPQLQNPHLIYPGDSIHSQVSSYQIIIINAGHQHQLSPGQLLSIQRHVKHTHPNHSASHKTSDEINFPQPSSTQEVLGSAVAFRVFEKITYCLILSAERPIRIGDRVENSLMR